MKEISFRRIAIGTVEILKKKRRSGSAPACGKYRRRDRRYEAAGELAKQQLQSLYEKALEEVGEASAAIFRVHELMLSDMDFADSITNMIRTQNVNAEYAAAITSDNFSALFEAMDDDYMRARAADVKDVSERLIRILSGQDQGAFRERKR